jgi:protein-S-isoprenylcysteine O-methyltransferase Ste14
MTPLPFTWPHALPFWAVYVWAFWPEFAIVRRAQKAQGPSDSKSLQVILLGQSVASLGSFVLAFVPALQLAPAYRVAALYAGIALMVGGALLRRHCRRMLGASFTGDVRARSDQEVVSRGAYRILRHPSYTAAIILNAGVGIALGSWASAVLFTAATAASYVYRMNVEERALLAAIGEPYGQFMRTRKRLIPFLY